MTRIVVIGNGPAAHRLVTGMHHYGHNGTVTVLGAEPEPAYNRALLTCALAGQLPLSALALPPLADPVRTRTQVRAVRIDRRYHLVHTDGGATYGYDRLVLATGARPTLPALPGMLTPDGRLAEGIATVRTIADCRRLPQNGQVAVLGAGVLGVETALALRRAGREVALVHRHDRLMNRHLDEVSARLLLRYLEEERVVIESGRRAIEFEPGKLLLDDGRRIPAQTLLICTGVLPETSLARAAGLTVQTGVVVDDHLRTNDPLIHAIGDCAQHSLAVPGQLTSAWDQADVLAAVLTGHAARYRGTRPIIRPRAAGLHLTILGAHDVHGEETVTLSAEQRYARLTLDHGRLLGGVLVGLPRAIAAAGQLYERGMPVPADRLAFLLGTPVTGNSSPAHPDDAVLCHCNHVTRRQLLQAWRAGSRDLASLSAATRATTGCGGCAAEIETLSSQFAPEGLA